MQSIPVLEIVGAEVQAPFAENPELSAVASFLSLE